MKLPCGILLVLALQLVPLGALASAEPPALQQGKRYELKLADGSAIRGTVSFVGASVTVVRLDNGVVRQLEPADLKAATELPRLVTEAERTAAAEAAPVAPAPSPAMPQGGGVAAGTWELRFGTGAAVSLTSGSLSPGGQNGLGVLFPSEGNDSLTLFGLNFGFARYLNAHVAVGLLLDLGVARFQSTTLTAFGLSPLVRGLAWLSKRASFFGELQLGYSGIFPERGSASFFRLGVNVGVEYLVGASWGLRVGSGFGALVGVGDTKGNLYEVPLRWGIVGYF